MTNNNNHPFHHSFMISLVVLAIIGLTWLFLPFLPALFFALLVASASYSYYQQLQCKFSSIVSALIMCITITLVILVPLFYILLVIGSEASTSILVVKHYFQNNDIEKLGIEFIAKLPLPDVMINALIDGIKANIDGIIIAIKNALFFALEGISSASFGFLGFIVVGIFSLFYFYLDGKKIINYLKESSPLENKLDNILIVEFSQLSITLVSSVVIIAILQGLVFGIGVSLVGLHGLFLGLSMAIASFIPILGGLIIWLPLGVYLFLDAQTTQAIIVVLVGGVLVGGIIDNIIRPWLISKISAKFGHKSALEQTLITVLATLAGIIQFGILGLFFGPIIAAMAISVFHAYNVKYKDVLDKT